MAEIIQFEDYSQEHSTPTPESSVPRVRIESDDNPSNYPRGEEYISPSRLYPLGEPKKLDLPQAIKLLEEARKYVSSAIESIEEDELVAAELSMQHLKSVMPELFCHRNIGDGFASIVSCIFYSIENNGHLEFTKEQIVAVCYAIKNLSDDPFIAFDGSLDLIDGLEQAGFTVEPNEFKELSEILDG